MKKKISNFFKVLIFVLLILFTTIYISNKNGYYIYNNYRKNILTEENIKRFEADIENGDVLDINNYLENDKDYSNNISKFSLNVSNKVGRLIRRGIVSFFDKITKNIK